LGTGDRQDRFIPARSGDATDWDSVAMGSNHACGIRAGALYCWGRPALGALGHDGTGLVAERVGTASDWIEVSAGLDVSCGLRAGGALYCWGYNGRGQIGVGTSELYYATPQRVTSLDASSAVSAHLNRVCAISGGRLFCWGAGESADIGGSDRPLPEQVTSFVDWTALDLDTGGGCALRDWSRLHCWGSELGATPVELTDRDDWVSVSSDSGHYCGVTQSGRAYCAGGNQQGA